MIEKRKKRSSSIGVIGFMVVAVLFAAIAGVLLSHLLGQKYNQEPVLPIVVAARDITPGVPLTIQDLRVAHWPRSSIPRGSYDAPQRLVEAGAVTLIPLIQSEPVLANHLSNPRAGLGVAVKLQAGQRAIAIRTDPAVTLAQLVYPGARVDLLTTLRMPGQGQQPNMTKVFLQNILVLAVGPSIDPLSIHFRPPVTGPQGMAPPPSNEAQAARHVVTLALTPEQAERMVLASREGRIDLVLRSPKDEEDVSTPGATSFRILGEMEGGRWDPTLKPPSRGGASR